MPPPSSKPATRYTWLNDVQAVAVGELIPEGVSYKLYALLAALLASSPPFVSCSGEVSAALPQLPLPEPA